MLVLTQENLILYVLIGLVVFMCLTKKKNYEKFSGNEQLSSIHKIDTNMCSPDCCGTQWPVSFQTKKDARVDKDKYIPTNMTCTGLRGRGCVCAEKAQYDFLKSRGNNS